MSEYNRLSLALLEVSCILHDVGKANVHFQNKLLLNGAHGDYYRHEYISHLFFVCMLQSAIRELKKSSVQPTEHEIINILSDYTTLQTILTSIDGTMGELSSQLHHDFYRNDINVVIPLMTKSMEQKNPLLFSISFLILSHHRLPWMDHTFKKLTPHEKTLINIRCSDIKDDNLKIIDSRMFNNRAVVKRLANAFKIMGELHSNINHDTLLKHISMMHRTSMVLGDHYASSQSMVSKIQSGLTFAKSQLDDNGNKVYGDTLLTHTMKVTTHARKFFNVLTDDFHGKMPTIRINHPGITRQVRDKQSQFYWQTNSTKKINSYVSKGIRDNGFFGINLAGTGTGKTRANVKLIRALSPNQQMRFTLAVGLRTLTLQTNTEYKDELGLSNDDDVGMIMGSPLTKCLYDLDNTHDGSIIENDEYGDFNFNFKNDDKFIDKNLGSILSEKDKILIHNPIIVCTTDQIIGMARMNRSRFISSSLRLMSSDLILDEIDSYTNTDIVALGLLIYRTGMSGRKVIISSATINPVIAKQLFEAYSNGYKVYCDTNNKPYTLFSGWFSENYTANQIVDIDPNDPLTHFNNKHDTFAQNIITIINKKAPKRRGEILNTTFAKDDEFFDIITRRCKLRHKQHHTTIDGINISVGLVKFNAIRSAFKFSKYLLDEQHIIPNVKVVCYHSRHLHFVLNTLEKELNGILKRKKSGDFENNHLIKRIVHEAKVANIQDIQIIISSTSIEEVGRDHDFDYAVTELTTYKSLVQLAGRVLRHRDIYPDEPNIDILSKNLANHKNDNVCDFDTMNDYIVSHMAGGDRSNQKSLEGFWHSTKCYSVLDINDDNSIIINDTIFDKDILNNINASYCISETDTNSSLLHHYDTASYNALLSTGSSNIIVDKLSLSNYVNDPFMSMSLLYHKKNPFRSSHINIMYHYAPKRNKWYRAIEDKFIDSASDMLECTKFYMNEVRVDNKDKLLIEYDVNDLYNEYNDKLNHISMGLRFDLSVIRFPNYNEEKDFDRTMEYNDFLGMIRQATT